jgi:protein-S-isoprenylcysteine O-methyltransferase Ste14
LKKRAVKDIVFVSIQLVLFVLYVIPAPSASFNLPTWLHYLTLALAATGLMVLTLAIVQLNKNLTPFPTPKTSGTLIQTGLYRYVRHPIYSGIIVMAIGFGVFQESTWKLALGILLWVLFYFKSRYEETLLVKQYPDYEAYRMHTSRFFPFL